MITRAVVWVTSVLIFGAAIAAIAAMALPFLGVGLLLYIGLKGLLL